MILRLKRAGRSKGRTGTRHEKIRHHRRDTCCITIDKTTVTRIYPNPHWDFHLLEDGYGDGFIRRVGRRVIRSPET
jgi:hypothetical protein